MSNAEHWLVFIGLDTMYTQSNSVPIRSKYRLSVLIIAEERQSRKVRVADNLLLVREFRT
jgi:hypothetical protein